uniref:Transcription initiation factor TFIID subunit 11 n=2 Tax=Kalmanozyma brasiliensis (strain GHG001) TaxID=1365824 RepID=V5ERX6_KALBG
MTGTGVIPESFFDMPFDYGTGDANMDFGSMPGFPTGDVAMSNSSDFDALTAQIAASMPPLPSASYPTTMMAGSQPYSAGVKMEMEDSSSVPGASPMTAEGSTPKPAAPKAKKPAKPKEEGAEAKTKKPKKKPAAIAATDAAATASPASSGPVPGSSKDSASSSAPKPKKTVKKKNASTSKDQPPSATTSPAAFATPASPSKDTKSKGKKASASKAGGKAASKARSTTARSASRMSSIGRDAGTPAAASRVGSQRPQDEANDDDEPAPNRAAPQEDEEADDEEVEADDGVEELGKDHFSTQEAIYAAQQRNMGLLSMVMDEDQLDRHMASRRGALNKTSVRKLVNHVLSQSVSQHVAMVVSGVAKIFVGEIVEKAREIQAMRGEQGPLRPNHLREAHRQYYLKRERPGHYPPGTNAGFPGVGKKRRMF